MELKASNSPLESFENDLELWHRLKSGDKSALSIIYQKYIRRLYNYGMTVSGNSALVKDAIQDLFIGIWVKRDRLGVTDNVLYYLLKSLRRELIRSSEKQLKHQDKRQSFLMHVKFPDQFQSSPESQIIQSESEQKVREAVRNAINHLPERQREVLFLLYYEKLSFEEVSSMMSIDLKTVYKLNWRAIGQLRTVLSKSLFTTFLLLSCQQFL